MSVTRAGGSRPSKLVSILERSSTIVVVASRGGGGGGDDIQSQHGPILNAGGRNRGRHSERCLGPGGVNESLTNSNMGETEKTKSFGTSSLL
jgi:hypothetical protein